ncbi:hypothetical protein [Sulfurimonas sp.]|uniref:hypothetical protein n=1 Tax=Sulfurimonas sp. TaxID=2022749 RepID=UPI00356B16E0
MNSRMYLGQESLEDVLSHIQGSLKRGSSVFSIARGMLGTPKAELIITKEYEMLMDAFKSDVEVVKLLVEYINDTFNHDIQKSCVSDVIKSIMEKHFYGIDIDDYSDHLTELLNSGAYQRVNHHLTNIMASYEVHMKTEYPKEFENMTTNEHEVAIIDFIKENLVSCTYKKSENN